MSADAERAMRPVETLLASADIYHTACGNGQLQWQHWSAASSATPLVLLHGGFGSWTHWYANIDGLRQRRDLWTVDLPGLGASAELARDAQPVDIAAVVFAGIEKLLGKHRVFELAGFSFGAMIGARIAELAGSRCLRFTAIGAAGCGGLHVQVPLTPPPPIETPWDQSGPVHRANLQALMFSAGAVIDELAVRLHADNLARHRFNSRPLSLTDDFLQALPRLEASLVGVWGSEDATAGGAGSIARREQLFAEAQPGAVFHILDGVGHWAMYEAPLAVNRILLA